MIMNSIPGRVCPEATASVSYVQSLFRGAGTQVNTAYIRIAEHQRNQVTAATKQDVIDVLAYADKIYWSYFAACKNLDIRKEQYNLAQKQLDQARKKVAAGAAAGIEIVRAEAGLSSRLENVITAQSSVQSAARQLQRVMNRPDLTLDKTLTFEPQTHPAPQGLTLNPESLGTTGPGPTHGLRGDGRVSADPGTTRRSGPQSDQTQGQLQLQLHPCRIRQPTR